MTPQIYLLSFDNESQKNILSLPFRKIFEYMELIAK